MQAIANPTPPPLLDLKILEIYPAPVFVIKVGTAALAFELLYTNESFRNGDYREAILGGNKSALLFRSWAQATGELNKPLHEFAGRTWVAEFSRSGATLKVLRAVGAVTEEQEPRNHHEAELKKLTALRPLGSRRSTVYTRSKEDFMEQSKRNEKTLLQDIPRTDSNARWERLQTMMEMSDVGVFEFNAEGKLMNANEAWYRLRCAYL
jgi:PAS domain-containing protein